MAVDAELQEIAAFPEGAKENMREAETAAEAETADSAKSAEPDLMQREPGIFEYGGFHFEAVGKLQENFNAQDIILNTRSHNELGISDYEDGQHPYSHSSFYEASTDKTADVFRCVETGKN